MTFDHLHYDLITARPLGELRIGLIPAETREGSCIATAMIGSADRNDRGHLTGPILTGHFGIAMEAQGYA